MALQDMSEPIDLDRLVGALARAFAGAPPTGPVIGRTQLKSAVAYLLNCSELQAEQLVDSLILRGKLACLDDPETPGLWQFRGSTD